MKSEGKTIKQLLNNKKTNEQYEIKALLLHDNRVLDNNKVWNQIIKETKRKENNLKSFKIETENTIINKKKKAFDRHCHECGCVGTFTNTCSKVNHQKICLKCNMIHTKLTYKKCDIIIIN